MKSNKKARRAGGRLKLGQLETEVTQQPEPPSSININDLELKERFERLRQNRKIEEAKKVIKNLYGKHNPINYKPEYHFQQSWQAVRTSSDENQYSSWKNGSKLVNILQLIFIVIYTFSLWFLSVHRIFQVHVVNQYIITGTILAQILDIVLEEASDSKKEQSKIKQIVKKNILSIFLLLYFAFMFIEQQLLEKQLEALIPIDLLFGVKIYRRLKQLYVLLKIKIPSYWRNEVEITQLVGGCLILVHAFSIVLYVASQSDGRANWTLGVTTFNSSWAYRYIFSVYFACTTMFTVGYGDITPQNPWEILAVLMVQVVGIINMGYVINEVGRYLSKINEGEELLYRGISDAEKLSDNYSLPAELSQKMTSFVINNQIANNKFNVEEQNSFLEKLSEEVRQDVTGYTKFQLIKTSVFFLCHWTKKFQRTIADKLIRQVYSPEQVLPQIHGKEKIYILSRGKINIEANFISKQINFMRKRLATIEVLPEKDVQFNIYGYTALISGHKINLCAVAHDYSICYYVDKDSIINTASENFTDFQYFHQIRSKIEESYCRQYFQAPKINNTKEHYIPNIYFILKRQRHKKHQKQKRHQFLRSQNKNKCLIYSESTNSQVETVGKKKRRASIEDASLVKQSQDKIANSTFHTLSSMREKQFIWDQKKKKAFLVEKFEQFKQYSSFRKKFNCKLMINKYNNLFHKSNETEEAFASFFLRTSGKKSQKLSEDAFIKLLNTRAIGK